MLLKIALWYLAGQAVFSVAFVWLILRYWLRSWSAPAQTKQAPTFAPVQHCSTVWPSPEEFAPAAQ